MTIGLTDPPRLATLERRDPAATTVEARRTAIDIIDQSRLCAVERLPIPLEIVERGPQGGKGDRGDVGPAGPVGPQGGPGPVGPQGGLPNDYPVAVTAGQTVIPLSPPPAAPETIELTVNHFVYRAPASFTFDRRAAAILWAGGFDLRPDDDVSVSYF